MGCEGELVLVEPRRAIVVGEAQRELRIPERLVEEARIQIEGNGVKGQHAHGEPLHDGGVFQHLGAEPG